MKKFEYKVAKGNVVLEKEMINELNNLGQIGYKIIKYLNYEKLPDNEHISYCFLLEKELNN